MTAFDQGGSQPCRVSGLGDDVVVGPEAVTEPEWTERFSDASADRGAFGIGEAEVDVSDDLAGDVADAKPHWYRCCWFQVGEVAGG
jgi:hypothetical protein